MENRSKGLFQQFAGELIVELELDLAGRIAERFEMPAAVKVLERTVAQIDLHEMRGFLVVLRGEIRLDTMVVDVQRRYGLGIVAMDQFGAAAPGQEARVFLHCVYKMKHLSDAVFDQDGLADFGHDRHML